jgi:YVTN family beta-propeller protein
VTKKTGALVPWGLAVVVLPALVEAWFRPCAASLTLPAPIYFEDFDATPEGTLPPGWTATNFTEILNATRDFANLDSAAYAGWTVVSADRFRGPLVQYSNPANASPVYQRVLSSNPANVVNGQVVTNLARGRLLFANSGYRRGRGQVQYLFTPDYDLAGHRNVCVSFHSLYEQNQDSLGAVEYSTDGGLTWQPVVYLLDGADVVSAAGQFDGVATFSRTYSDVATYLVPGTGQIKGGYYGAFLGVTSNRWATLGPYVSARIDDDPVESKRVELFRVPAADDQPQVRFRFAHAGTDSWYFGVDDFGLYSINTNALPVIVLRPRDLRLSAGTTATFAVDVQGTGPWQCQWRREGVDLAGATNTTLAVSGVGSEDAGEYSVAIRNGAGTVYQVAGRVTVYTPRVTGQWDFDTADLRATLGADLEFLGDTASITQFLSMTVGGAASGVMGFGVESSTQGYRLRHGARANGGGGFVNQYTLLLDVRFPQASHDRWRALVQTDPFNREGNDADFYVGDGTTAPFANGVGIEDQYHGPLSPEAWHRLALVVDLAGPKGRQLTKYVDGVGVGAQSLSDGVDGRYALGPTLLLFTTGEGPGDRSRPGWVNSIQFVDGWLPEPAVAALGAPSAEGIPNGGARLRILDTARTGSTLTFEVVGGAGPFQLQRTFQVVPEDWEEAGGSSTNRTFLVGAGAAAAFYRVRTVSTPIRVGPRPDGEHVVATGQWLRPAGPTVKYGGRPVAVVLAPDGRTLYAKDNRGLVVVETASWTLRQQLAFGDTGGSMHGVAVRADGSRVYATTAGNQLCEATVGADGTLAWARRIVLPEASVGGSPFPCGVAVSLDGARACVCLSRNNTLAVVNLLTGAVIRQIPTGVAPFDVVLAPAGNMAYVSDWGGRRPGTNDRKAKSSGTDVLVDGRGVASSGTVSFVDLTRNVVTATVPVGLHPSGLVLSRDGATLYCANANSDSISLLATATATVRETITVRPDPALPYGSSANALALSPDGRRLFVANGGNNAIAVVSLPEGGGTGSVLEGFLPADWYPGGVATDGAHVYIANIKGLGSRGQAEGTTARSVYSYLGTLTKVAVPPTEAMSKLTAQVHEDARVPAMLRAWEQARTGQPPRPVPRRIGEPSVFQHVFYVIKENRTYDQIFGDLPQGNGDPSLCVFGRHVTPNHHALAEQFVLLDNFYCNGVNSSDGHAWATEGNVADYLEKTFGGATRGYTWGDDPLSYSATGFIWDNVLLHGLGFRNYGEMDYAETVPSGLSWLTVYRDFVSDSNTVRFSQNIGIEPLRAYSPTHFPGWNMRIPDVLRADRFIRDLRAAETTGTWPHFTILYLPNDHTSGTSPGAPTPRAQVADNDLALGRALDALTHSRFWSTSVAFVIEDDPQDGFDHVDGHRSLCLVVSPYTRRGAVIREFYNQTAVLHTMERILGIPPMNQLDAQSPLMTACFTATPDLTPYTALTNNVPLDEMNPGTAALKGRQLHWARQSMAQNFAQFDRANEDTLNRILWHSVKGVEAKYPKQWAGAHGRGLKKLGLVLDRGVRDDD